MEGLSSRIAVVSSLGRKGKRALEDPKRAWEHLLRDVSQRVEPRFNYGIAYLERDWDHLVILDACRYDLFTEFAPRHPVFESFTDVTPVCSNASSTPMWLTRNFGDSEASRLERLNYISATPWITDIDTTKLADVRNTWEYSQDPEAHVPRPEAVTDAAIESYRNDPSRDSVIHYVQPHAPFLHCPGKYGSRGDGDGGTLNVWRELRSGRYDPEEVWQDYGQNLLTVLNEVEILVENLGGDIVVSSDHGNAFGEFGIYGHPPHAPLPSIRRVPWAKTTGKATDSYEVRGKAAMSTESVQEDPNGDTGDGRDREEQLQALGYKT
jgi:hypothetical protein